MIWISGCAQINLDWFLNFVLIFPRVTSFYYGWKRQECQIWKKTTHQKSHTIFAILWGFMNEQSVRSFHQLMQRILTNPTVDYSHFLLTTYVVRWKVMFSVVSSVYMMHWNCIFPPLDQKPLLRPQLPQEGPVWLEGGHPPNEKEAYIPNTWYAFM